MSPEENNQVSPGDLVTSICKGPISLESTKILVRLFYNEKNVHEKKATGIDFEYLSFRLLKSGEIDSFIKNFEFISFEKNDQIKELLTLLKRRKNDHDLILKYMNPENFILQMELSEIVLNISNSNFNQYLIYFYIDCDPEFAKKFILKLNSNILRIINDFKSLTNSNDMIVYLFSAYVFIFYIPFEYSRFLPEADYEPLLDFTIELFKVKKFDDFTVPCHFIGNILSLPFVKITQSGLNKYFEILKYHYTSKKEYYFIYASYGIIFAKIKKKEELTAFEIFKMVFQLAESNQIDCICLASIICMFRSAVIRDLLNFCVEHHLLSKTSLFLIKTKLEFIGK